MTKIYRARRRYPVRTFIGGMPMHLRKRAPIREKRHENDVTISQIETQLRVTWASSGGDRRRWSWPPRSAPEWWEHPKSGGGLFRCEYPHESAYFINRESAKRMRPNKAATAAKRARR